MSTLKLQILLGAVDKLTAPLKAVSGQSRITAKDLAEAKTKVRDLEKQSAKIDGFKQLGAQLGVTNANLQTAKDRFEQVKQTIAATANPTRMMVNEYNKAEKAVKELTAKQAEMNSKYEGMKLSLQTATMGTKDLAKTQERLKNATAAANEKLKQQRADLDRIAEQQKRMNQVKANYRQTQELRGQMAGHGAAALATGTAMGMTTLKPVIEFAKAETAAVDLKVTMMGKGGVVKKEFQAISDLATQLGNKLPGTTADFQNMMNTLSQQGMTEKAILGGLGEATAYLGVQLKLPYDQAAQSASKLQDATRTTEKDMMGLMDVIQRAHYLGMDIGNQEAAYASLSPVLNLLKKDGLDAAKALSPLLVMADQASMGGEKAGNAYRKAFQRSMNAKNMEKANDLLKADGIKLDFTDGKGNFGGLNKMFAQLGKLKNLNEQKRLAVFNQVWGDDSETQQVLTLMMTKGLAGYNETIAKMEAQASLQERVNAQLGTLGNLWDAATGTFTNAMVNFGEAIAPEVKSVIEWIGELSERLGNWAKKNPELSNTMMRIAAFTSIAAIAFGGLSLAVAALLGPMAIMKLTFGVLGVTFGGLLGAVAAILAPLAALAVLGVTIIKFWEPISAFFSGLWQGIMTGLAPVFEAFKPFAPLLDGISSGVKTLSGWFGDLLEPIKFSKETLEGFGSAGQIVGRILGEAFNLALTPLKAFLKGIEWLLESLGILETKKIPKFDIPTASTPGYLNGNYGTPAYSSAYSYGSGPRIVEPARIKPANKQTIDNSINSPIYVYQQPGQSSQDVAKTVRDEMQKMQREERAKGRASLRDNS
ncbi:phage tail tape measure protein [Aeromonas veronii]|uniref:phage tail tape measure protein n=1 Tax=Aeromonas veronii TaxID=654 RepID=UPI00226CA53F|nr:phage tail tape measure protein [Aeromonas veronii]MCX9105843.1 phage tail tape measure protein [Aeromonas veronii]MCX9121640.1 phage tail tape measure protein [Aeromonas veronii]